MTDKPDPVDRDALLAHLAEHKQVPEQEEWWSAGSHGFSPRSVNCTAHGEGQNCCLDYFHDTILEALQAQRETP